MDDLLGFYPRDYVDYSHPYPVAGAPYDVKCVVRATVYGKNGGARIRAKGYQVESLAVIASMDAATGTVVFA